MRSVISFHLFARALTVDHDVLFSFNKKYFQYMTRGAIHFCLISNNPVQGPRDLRGDREGGVREKIASWRAPGLCQ